VVDQTARHQKGRRWVTKGGTWDDKEPNHHTTSRGKAIPKGNPGTNQARMTGVARREGEKLGGSTKEGKKIRNRTKTILEGQSLCKTVRETGGKERKNTVLVKKE